MLPLCLVGLALVVVGDPPAHMPIISAADQAAMERLDDMTKRLGNPEDGDPLSSAEFERAFPRSQVARWKRLQRLFPPSTEYGLNLAFLLAYYHVDYPDNINRLLWPYKMWVYARKQPWSQYEKLEKKLRIDALGGLAILSDDSNGLLQTLYDTRRDIYALRLSCGMWLTGGPGEGQAEGIADYWNHHPTDLMRAAAGYPNAQQNIAEVIVEDKDMIPELPPVDKSLAKLYRFSRSHDPNVAIGAASVLKRVLALMHPEKQRKQTRNTN